MSTLSQRKQTYRNRVESQETYRDYIIDIVGVWGPLLAPAVPAALTMVSIAMHYPELLHIHWLAALAIGLIVAVVIEVLGVVSVETFLDMKSYNQTIDEGEELAPVGWAGAIMGLYILIVISLVVLLKMVPQLALVSLVPLTLLAGVTSWIVVMRKQHRERTYKRDLAEMEDNQLIDLSEKLDILTAENDQLLSEIAKLNGQIERLEAAQLRGLSQSHGLNSAVGNQAKQDKRQANIDLLFAWLSVNPDSKKADMLAMFEDNGIEISDKTVSRYLSDLGAIRNGHSYSLPNSWDQMELPTLPNHKPSQPVLNGTHR